MTSHPQSAVNPTRRPDHGWLRHGVAVGVAVAVFLIYLATAARNAWWGDGLEFACAAWTLGIPHPTGYPLYIPIAHVVMKTLAFLDPGQSLTVFGAFLLAVAGGLSVPLYRRVMTLDFYGPAQLGGAKAECACGMTGILPAVGVALLVAFTRTVWENATYTDVFPLTFLLGMVLLRLAWTPAGQATPRRAAALGLVLGLAALNHYSILALFPLAFLCVVRWAWRSDRRPVLHRFRLWIVLPALLGFLILLMGYFTLILRARYNPPLNWGDPSSLDRLFWVLKGGQFRQIDVDAGTGAVAMGLGRWLYWWGTLWVPVRLAGTFPALLLGAATVGIAIWGLILLSFRRWELGLGLLAAILATAGFGALYHIPDIDSYFIIALPAAASGWIIASQRLLTELRRRSPDLLRGPLFRALPAVLALTAMLTNYGSVDKSWDEWPLGWGAAVMEALPKNALVITGGDLDIYSLWYQQMVLGQRPDVTIFGSKFIFSGWYAKYFEVAGRPKIPVHVEDRPPKDKLTYDVALFSGVILPNLAQGRPVFVTYQDDPPSLLAKYLSPKPVAALFPPSYREVCAYPFGLPSPVLYALQPSPKLAGLDKDALAQEFRRFYMENSPPAAFHP